MSQRKSVAPGKESFSAEEKAAMQERARELKAESRRSKDRAAGEQDLLAKLAEMPEHDRLMGERIHAIVKAVAPELFPKTWYGMPAYANQEGKVVCFYQSAAKFNARYATLGFNDAAHLDQGNMWATAFALIDLTPAEEEQIAALVKKAVS